MSQNVTINTISTLTAVLVNSSNAPVTSLPYTAVSVSYRKYGGSSFTSKSLSSSDWAEIGLGVYTVKFTATELNTLGALVWVVNSASTVQFVDIANVEPVANVDTPVSLSTCLITGYIFDLSGNAVEGSAVTARVLGFPATVDNTAMLTDSTVTVYSDAAGEFFLPLVRLAYVDISAPDASYRRQLVVPDASSANLFTIE